MSTSHHDSEFSGAAIDLGIRGYWVAPLHPQRKTPITEHGIRDSVNTTRQIWEYWHPYPQANIAIDLQRSALVGIGPDSPEWLTRIREWGLPNTMLARSGGGDGHLHYYYRRPAGCPVFRINRSGEYDLQTDGYFVAPPSIHPSGQPYVWVTPLRYAQDLPEAPEWAVKMLSKAASRLAKNKEATTAIGGAGDPPVRLCGEAIRWWTGEKFASNAGGVDRSKTLFTIGLLLARANASASAITQALADRDATLEYCKYAARRDAEIRYSEIASRVTDIVIGHHDLLINPWEAIDYES
jgi:hypothetical protein